MIDPEKNMSRILEGKLFYFIYQWIIIEAFSLCRNVFYSKYTSDERVIRMMRGDAGVRIRHRELNHINTFSTDKYTAT